MKRVLIILVAIAVALAPYGTAHAYPVKDKTLTANALYSAGELDTGACAEKRVRPRDAALVKAYLYGVLDCLNTTWAAQLRKSGQSFRKPVLKITTKAPKRFCSWDWDEQESYYCDETRTIFIFLSKDRLANPTDLWLFNVLSSEYGQHIQHLIGIYDAYQGHAYRNKKELREQLRRYQLQSICFGTAFLRSTWKSLGRSTSDWNHVARVMQDWADPEIGSRANIDHWANRGFSSGDPSSCNTWTASSERVAERPPPASPGPPAGRGQSPRLRRSKARN